MTQPPSTIPAIQAAPRTTSSPNPIFWTGERSELVYDEPGIRARLLELDRPCYAIRMDDHLGFANSGSIVAGPTPP